MRIEFVIDELVLDGFDPRDRHRIGDAIESRLAALVSPGDVGDLVARAASLSVVRAPSFTLSRRASEASAVSIADGTSRAILAALRGGGASAPGEPPGKGVPS
jgi:hypothetical protein